MSRYGWISRSLMNCQMIRVISSPASSTTVPSTLIFDMPYPSPRRTGVVIAKPDGRYGCVRVPGARVYGAGHPVTAAGGPWRVQITVDNSMSETPAWPRPLSGIKFATMTESAPARTATAVDALAEEFLAADA